MSHGAVMQSPGVRCPPHSPPPPSPPPFSRPVPAPGTATPGTAGTAAGGRPPPPSPAPSPLGGPRRGRKDGSQHPAALLPLRAALRGVHGAPRAPPAPRGPATLRATAAVPPPPAPRRLPAPPDLPQLPAPLTPHLQLRPLPGTPGQARRAHLQVLPGQPWPCLPLQLRVSTAGPAACRGASPGPGCPPGALLCPEGRRGWGGRPRRAHGSWFCAGLTWAAARPSSGCCSPGSTRWPTSSARAAKPPWAGNTSRPSRAARSTRRGSSSSRRRTW